MNDVFYAVIFVTLWIGAAIVVNAMHIGGRIDELRHEIWELRKDIQENETAVIIVAERKADADYQASVLMQEYFERYEPTYNSEDGSM